MMEYKPKQIIEQAREKAQKALFQTCGEEIQRICEAFSHDTGLSVNSIHFYFMDVTSVGSAVNHQNLVLGSAKIDHEDA